MRLIPTALVMIALCPMVWSQTAKVPTHSPQVGRFVAITPPNDPNSGYPNFLWVLDSATGKMTVHRIASYKDNGVHKAWVVEQGLTQDEYYQKLWDEMNRKEKTPK